MDSPAAQLIYLILAPFLSAETETPTEIFETFDMRLSLIFHRNWPSTYYFSMRSIFIGVARVWLYSSLYCFLLLAHWASTRAEDSCKRDTRAQPNTIHNALSQRETRQKTETRIDRRQRAQLQLIMSKTTYKCKKWVFSVIARGSGERLPHTGCDHIWTSDVW